MATVIEEQLPKLPQIYVTGNSSILWNVTEPHEWSDEVVTQVSIIVTVMVLAFVGNLSLIVALVRNSATRRRRLSVFLVNLALGDLTVCVFTMTTEIVFVAFGEWVLGAVACKLSVYIQMVTLASSTFLLTAMSIDRYQVIVRPLQCLVSRPTIWKKVAAAWTLALIFASPQLFIFVEVLVDNNDGRFLRKCLSRGYTNPEWQRKVYMTFMASYVLVIPTVIMSYCYTKIIWTLWRRALDQNTSFCDTPCLFNHSHHAGEQHSQPVHMRVSARNKDLMESCKRKIVKLSLVVIFCFLICWTPYFVVSLIRIYSNYTIRIDMALDLSKNMALVHSALNPLIYGLFHIKFSRIFPCLKYIRRLQSKGCCARRHDSEYETSSSCVYGKPARLTRGIECARDLSGSAIQLHYVNKHTWTSAEKTVDNGQISMYETSIDSSGVITSHVSC